MENIVKEAGPAGVFGIVFLLVVALTASVESTVGTNMSNLQIAVLAAFPMILIGLIIREVK